MNPFAGSWIANLEKSQRHANHQFTSATLTFEISGDVVSMTHAGVNMSGRLETGKTRYIADGREHPVNPQAPGVVAVTRFVDPRTLLTQANRDGQPLASATYAISEDGRTLTATVAGVDAAGRTFDQVIVFDRRP